MPGGATAVGKVSRWGVGGSLCAGPARSPALAASLRAREGCRGQVQSGGAGWRPAVRPRDPLPSPTRCVPPPRVLASSLPLSPATAHPCSPVPTRSVPRCPGPDPFSGARPAGRARGTEGLCGACCGRGAAGWERGGGPQNPRGGSPG